LSNQGARRDKLSRSTLYTELQRNVRGDREIKYHTVIVRKAIALALIKRPRHD